MLYSLSMPSQPSFATTPRSTERERAEKTAARYERLRLLGQGGMGMVYEVFDKRRERRVAMKVLKDPERGSLYRFKREFRAAADLVHPNLVRLYDLGVFLDGSFFFTMELVAGRPLSELLHRGVMPEQSLGNAETLLASTPVVEGFSPVRVLAGIAEGLLSLHVAKKVHRDLKPSNVIVEEGSGIPKLLDFGIMRDADAPGATKGALGTPLYMAPEQAQGKEVDWRADMYSFGCLLYEMLAGRPPFQGNGARVILSHLSEEPAPPSRVRPCPAPLERLCLALLQKDPALRPSASEVLQLLHEELGGPAPQPRRPVPRSAGLFGRSAEIGALRERLLSAAPGAVLLTGEAGSGKSALCEDFAHQAQERGEAIFLGRCYEREQVPYKALDAIVDGLALDLLRREVRPEGLPPGVSSLARLFPVLLELPALRERETAAPLQDPHAERARALRALFALLRQRSPERPPLVVIEDLQWADPESLEALRWMLGPDGPPLRLLLSARADAVACSSGELDALLAPHKPLALRLGPLSDEAIEALVEAQAASTLTASSRRRLALEARGNPFLAAELARAVAERGAGDDPPSVEALVSWRLGRVSPAAQATFAVAAVVGGRADFSLLASLAGLSPGVLSEALDELLQARLVRESWGEGDGVEIADARFREAAYLGLPEAQRLHLHRALADHWAEQGDFGRAVDHWRAAQESDRAREAAARAAKRAEEQLAFARAAALYALAAEGDRAGPLLLARAVALRQAGLHAESAAAYEDAAPLLPEEEAQAARIAAAAELLAAGEFSRGLAAFEALLRPLGETLQLRPGLRWYLSAAFYFLWIALCWVWHDLLARRAVPAQPSPARLARLKLYGALYHCLMPLDPFVALWFGMKCTREAHRLRDPAMVGVARIGHATVTLGALGRRVAARAYRNLQNGEALCAEHNDPRGLLDAEFTRALLFLYEGNLTALAASARRSEEIARRGGFFSDPFFLMMRDMSLGALYYAGQFAQAEERCLEAIRDANARGSSVDAALPHAVLALSYLMTSGVERARVHFQKSLDSLPAEPLTMLRFRVELYALELYAAEGRFAEGLAALDALRLRWRKQSVVATNLDESAAALLDTRFRLAMQVQEGCVHLSLKNLRFSTSASTPMLLISALRVEAAVLRMRGRPHAAIARVERSLWLAEQQGSAVGCAFALRARSLLREEQKLPGATFDRQRADALLRELGLSDCYQLQIEGWHRAPSASPAPSLSVVAPAE